MVNCHITTDIVPCKLYSSLTTLIVIVFTVSHYVDVLVVMFRDQNCYYTITLTHLFTATTLNIYCKQTQPLLYYTV